MLEWSSAENVHLVRARASLAGYNEPFKAVLEASYSWGPMYDWLDDMSKDVLLAHPLKVRAIASAPIANDRIDSEVIAHLLRPIRFRQLTRLRERSVGFGAYFDSGCSSFNCARCYETEHVRC